VLAHAYGDVHAIYDHHDRIEEKRAALGTWERHRARSSPASGQRQDYHVGGTMTRQRREMIAELTDRPEAIIAKMTAKLHAMVDAARAMTPQQREVIAELVGRYEALIAKVVAPT
jgi:hypothetical protein